jgi:hypothetical protein
MGYNSTIYLPVNSLDRLDAEALERLPNQAIPYHQSLW